MNTSRRAVSSPLVTGLRVAAGLVGGAIALGTAAVATASFVMARRVVTPAQRAADTRILALDVKAQTITLTRTPDTELPGRYGLHVFGTDRYLKLGSVLSMDDKSVTRKLLTQVGPSAKPDRDAAFSGWYYARPEELQLDFTPELIGSSVGACPAWLFPGDDTWVINVHGRGVTRAETLRAVPVFEALGYTSLLVSYRNDGEAPRTASGTYGMGATEWLDVDAAIAYAQRHGARRIILMGWSMGGAIVMQTLRRSARAHLVAGVVLESPVIEWREVLAHQAKLNRVPGAIGSLAVAALGSEVTARLAGAEAKIPFDELDMVAHADALTVPMLILHSVDDGFVPSDASQALADARPDLVALELFTKARHTKLWNYDEARWTNAISDWVTTLKDPVPHPDIVDIALIEQDEPEDL